MSRALTGPAGFVAAFAAASCALLITGPSAQASSCSRFASPSGSDSAAGSEPQPFRSAQRLAGSLSAGQTGCLRAGTYSGAVNIANAGVTLRSHPGEKATLTGGQLKVFGDRVTVEQLYLRNTNGRPSPTVNASDVTLRNNDISNDHTGICMILGNAHGTYARAVRTRVENNRIHDCGKLPSTNQNHGIYVEGADETQITGNWIYDNADRGIQLYPDARNSLVSGNVIDGNGTGITFSGALGLGSRYNRVEGNVLSNASTRYNVESWWAAGTPRGVGNTLSANCLYRSARGDRGLDGVNTASGGFGLSDNVTAAPRFRSRGGKDYRLSGGACAESYTGPNETPCPGVTQSGLKAALLKLRVKPKVIRQGRRALVVGRADTSRVKPGARVSIYGKIGRRRQRFGRCRVRANGGFRMRPRLRTKARRVRLVATVRGVGGSRPVAVRVRRS